MKKLFYIFSSIILFCSCSITAVKEDKNAPINDYLEIQNLGNQKIMIIKEKINNNITIAIFEGQTFYHEESDKYVKVEGVQEPLYNKQLWEKMKLQYKNKDTTGKWVKKNKWSPKDFKHKNILFFLKLKSFLIQESMKNLSLMIIIKFLLFQNLSIMIKNMPFLLKRKQTQMKKHLRILR